MPCHGPTSSIYSLRDFPKWAAPEVFGLQSVEESDWAVNFIRKLPRPILKTEIVQRTEPAYWVLSQRSLCGPSLSCQSRCFLVSIQRSSFPQMIQDLGRHVA